MAEIQTNLLKSGMTVKFRDSMYEVVSAQHVKPGKGTSFTKVKFKSLETGRNIEMSLKPVDKVERLFSEEKNMEYLYREGENLVLMDNQTYEQEYVNANVLGDSIKYLKENINISVKIVEGQILSMSLPCHMVLQVAQTDPGLKGDTAQGGSKPATLETGAVVSVPLFINQDEMIRVDTRSDEYIERA